MSTCASLIALVNLSNQALGDYLRPYSDFLSLQTLLALLVVSNPEGISM